MLPRYIDNFQISTTRNGARYYNTNVPNVIQQDIFQLTITAQDGDRFDSLATKYYKDSSKWWIIAKANNLVNGTMFVQGGTKLIIPSAGLL